MSIAARTVLAVLACSVAGCSASGATPAGGDGGTAGAFGSGGSAGVGAGGTSPGAGGSFGGFGGAAATGNVDPDAACQATPYQAEKRLGGEADIIWALDNSGSMFDEAGAMQNNMNIFSSFIAGTGIDVRVVVISSPLAVIPFADPWGVCIAPPLGSGACPNDSNPPVFLHVLQEVDSHNALFQIQQTFDAWKGLMRPSSTKTFVVVTDDESNPPPTADEFISWVNAQPELQGPLWRFSGIFCFAADGLFCQSVGTVYQNLVQQTGGVAANLQTQDWSLIFQQLADAVIADAVPVQCEWVIPPPPPGEMLNPDFVNVRFTPSSGVVESVYGVSDPSQCRADFLGWYYDNPTAPTRLIACPESCTVLQADDSARIDVLFGCRREPPPIM